MTALTPNGNSAAGESYIMSLVKWVALRPVFIYPRWMAAMALLLMP